MTLNKNLNHHRKTADLARKVDDLARRYLNPKHPTPILREIILVPEQFTLLVDAITRQVSLIKCRSSSFEDGQVSIYDKALLWLTGMGADPTNLGALEFYLTEFIGVVPICSLSEGKRAVESHIKLHGIITKKYHEDHNAAKPVTSEEQSHRRTISVASSHKHRHDRDEKRPPDNQVRLQDPPTRYHGPKKFSHSVTSARRSHQRRRSSSRLTVSVHEENRHHGYDHEDKGRPRTESSLSASSSDSRVQEKIERILTVYTRAKDEYYEAGSSDIADKLSVTRFLRDTAENALSYLSSNGLSDHPSIPELEHFFQLARDKATELSGGRKRRFDADDASRPEEKRREKRSRRLRDSYRPS